MGEFTLLPIGIPFGSTNGTYGPGTSSASFLDVAHNALYAELYAALARRHAAAGGANSCRWPSRSHVYYSGVIGSDLDTTGFTDSTSPTTWKGGTDDGSGTDYAVPWFGVPRTSGETGNSGYPRDWYVEIDDPGYDFPKVVKLKIGSWTDSPAHITFDDPKALANLVTFGVVPSIDFLKGRNYNILGFSYCLTRGERVMEYADARHLADGIVTSLAANTNVTPALPASPAPGIFRPGTQTTQAFTNLIGQHFRCYDTNGLGRDAVIGATSTANVWYLTGATWTANVTSPWLVCANGARATPGRVNVSPFRVLRTLADTYLSADPNQNDAVVGVDKPAQYIGIITHQDDGSCELVNQPIFDLDYKTTPDGYPDAGDPGDLSYTVCSRPYDKHYNPNLYKDVRGMQIAALELDNSYVVDQSYSGYANIPPMNGAEHFLAASQILAAAGTIRAGVTNTLNVQLCTTTDVVGYSGTNTGSNNQINVTGWTPPHAGNLRVWYSVRHGDDSRNGGRGLMLGTNGILQTLTGTFTQGTSTTGNFDNACTVVLTPGWSAPQAQHVNNPYYDQDGALKPDINPLTGSPIDPPYIVNYTNSGSFGLGSYVGRPKDDHLVTRRTQSADLTDPEGFAWVGSSDAEKFVVGESYAYIGDPYFGPSIRDGNAFFPAGSVLAPYYARLRVGRLSPTHQPVRDGMLSGKVLAGGTFWFRSDKHWLSDPCRGGIASSFSGTVASGSLTSATFTLSGSDFAWWDAFPASIGTNGLLHGFTFEVDRGTGSNAGTWTTDYVERAYIQSASTNSTSGTANWTEPMSASPAGLPGRIRRPYYLNPYAHHPVTLTSPAGATSRATISASLDDWVYLGSSNTNTLGSGWTFNVTDHKPGKTITFNGTSAAEMWTDSSGSDTARLGVPHALDFTANPYMNLEYHAKRYGFAVPWQVPTPSLYNELWAMILALKKVYNNSVTWSAKSSATATPDNNTQNSSADTLSNASSTNTVSVFEGLVQQAYAARSGTPITAAGMDGSYGESSTGAAPSASQNMSWGEDDTDPTKLDAGSGVGSSTVYSYPVVTGISTCRALTHSTEIYAYAIIEAGDPDQQSSYTTVFADGIYSITDPLLFMPGSTGLQFRKFAPVSSSGGSNSTEYGSSVGTFDAPPFNNPGTTPKIDPSTGSPVASGATFEGATGGFVVTQQVAIVDFDFEGAAAAGF